MFKVLGSGFWRMEDQMDKKARNREDNMKAGSISRFKIGNMWVLTCPNKDPVAIA